MSKGSAQRPGNKQRFSDNYDRIFGSKNTPDIGDPNSFVKEVHDRAYSELVDKLTVEKIFDRFELSEGLKELPKYPFEPLSVIRTNTPIITKKGFDSLMNEDHKSTIIKELRLLASEGIALESDRKYVRCVCVPLLFIDNHQVQVVSQTVPADGGNYWLPPWEYLEMFLPQ